MKKIVKFLKSKYGFVSMCVVSAFLGFVLFISILSINTNSNPISVFAQSASVSGAVSCTSYKCDDANNCGVVCCGPSSGGIFCKSYNGSLWGSYVSL